MLTKKSFEKLFKEIYIPAIMEEYEQDGIPDRPARRQAWNDTVDAYVKDRQLPESAMDWNRPGWVETWGHRKDQRQARRLAEVMA